MGPAGPDVVRTVSPADFDALLRLSAVRVVREQRAQTNGGPDIYRVTRAEYDGAVEGGAFEPNAKLELIRWCENVSL